MGYRKLRDLFLTVFSRRNMQCGAALSYYLTLSVFPFLVLLSAVTGALGLSAQEVLSAGRLTAPPEVVSALEAYLEYAGSQQGTVLVTVSALMLLSSASAGFRTLVTVLGTQGQIPARIKGIRGLLLSMALTAMFMVAVAVSAAVMLLERWLAGAAAALTGRAPGAGERLLRFVPQFLLMWAALFAVFDVSLEGMPKRRVFSRALMTAATVTVFSIVFSYAVTAGGRYSFVYGSAASVIVMMLWFYACSVIVTAAGRIPGCDRDK